LLPAVAVPSDRVVDITGAGDVFHGAYVYSYLAREPMQGKRIFASLGRHPRIKFTI